MLQDFFNRPARSNDCWYTHLIPRGWASFLIESTRISITQNSVQRTNWLNIFLVFVYIRRCKDEFDFSDHIVLYTVQYIYIAAMEVSQLSSASQQRDRPRRLKYLLPILVSVFIILLSLRAIFFTAMFFHTTSENLAALLVVLLLALVPMKLLFPNQFF